MRKSITTTAAVVLMALGSFANVAAQTAADIRSEVANQGKKATISKVDHAKATSLAINPNTAPLDSLMLLPGVGEKTAQNIIDFRTSVTANFDWPAGAAAFEYVEDLEYIRGIGPKTVAKMQQFVSLPSAPVEDE